MTAVEWLEETIEKKHIGAFLKSVIQKAKEMEKQQIIEAHGDKLKISSGTTSFEYWLTGEDYYKKQFNK